MATLAQIKDEVYYLLNQRQNSQVYDYATRVLPKINRVQTQICKGLYVDVLTRQRYKSGDLRFLRKRMFFSVPRFVVIQSNVLVGATTINIADTSFLPSSGFLYIGGITVAFAGKTSNSVTGVTGMIGTANAGQKAYQVIQIPAEADRSFQFFNITRQGFEVAVPYCDGVEQVRKFVGFRIIEDNTTGNNYVLIVGEYDVMNFILYYYSKAVDMVNPTDVATIPDPYALECFTKIVAGELLRETEQDEQSKNLLALGYSNLSAFYQSFTDFHKPDRQTVIVSAPSIYY